MACKLILCSLLLGLLVTVLANVEKKNTATDEQLVRDLTQALKDVGKRSSSWGRYIPGSRGSSRRWGRRRDRTDDDESWRWGRDRSDSRRWGRDRSESRRWGRDRSYDRDFSNGRDFSYDKREVKDVAEVLASMLVAKRDHGTVPNRSDQTPEARTDDKDDKDDKTRDDSDAGTTKKKVSGLASVLTRVLADDVQNDENLVPAPTASSDKRRLFDWSPRGDTSDRTDNSAVSALVREFEDELNSVEKAREERGKKLSLFEKLKGKKKQKDKKPGTFKLACKQKGKFCSVKTDDCCHPYQCKKFPIIKLGKCASVWG